MEKIEAYILCIGKWGIYVFDTIEQKPLELQNLKIKIQNKLLNLVDVFIKSGKFGNYFVLHFPDGNIEIDYFKIVKLLNSKSIDCSISGMLDL